MSTRIETVPGNFNTGITLADLPITKNELHAWIDANSANVSGTDVIQSLISLIDSAVVPVTNNPCNLAVQELGVTIAQFISGGGRDGYKLNDDFMDNKSKMTMFGVVYSPDTVSIQTMPIFSVTSDNNLSSTRMELSFNATGSLRIAVRKNNTSESAITNVLTVPVDQWVFFICEIDFTENSLYLNCNGVEQITSNAFGDSDPTGVLVTPRATAFGRATSDDNSTTSNQFRSKWKLSGKYDDILTGKKRELLVTYLNAQLAQLST
jgi:hypothetical protein